MRVLGGAACCTREARQGDKATRRRGARRCALYAARCCWSIERAIGTVEIVDDDTSQLSIGDVTVVEDLGIVTVNVTLNTPSASFVTVEYMTSDLGGVSGAVVGDDYVLASGLLTFIPGDVSQTFTIDIVVEVLDELDETFGVSLFNEIGSAVLKRDAVVQITDDDAATISIGDVSVTEGQIGTTPVIVTVDLDLVVDRSVTVDFALAGTGAFPALGGTDYVIVGGTVTFAPFDVSENVTLTILTDTLDEYDETFAVDLSLPVNATIADAQAIVTIVDDDFATVSVVDNAVAEGASVDVTVQMDIESVRVVTVNVSTADGTAVAPADYASGVYTVVFQPGETSHVVSVATVDDNVDEANEVFAVVATGAANATVADAQGDVTIADNDALSMSIADVTLGEAAGSVATGVNVTLTGVADRTISVTYTMIDGTAIEGLDYTGSPAVTGVLTWNAGETGSRYATIDVIDSSDDELDETFDVVLSGASAGVNVVKPGGVVTIVDDDVIAVSVQAVTVAEGAGSPLAVQVSLNGTSDRTVSVTFSTGGGSASQPDDYLFATGTLTWLAGETGIKSAPVTIVDDAIDEADETFVVRVTSVVPGGVLGLGDSAVVTIDDDEDAQFSVDSQTVVEGDVPTVTVTVTLDYAVSVATSVAYTTTGGSATSGVDFAPASGTLSFGPGTVAQTFDVVINDDSIDEGAETFTVDLSGATGGGVTIGTGSGTVGITDDDVSELSVSDSSVVEGDSGVSVALVTVQLSLGHVQNVTVDYALVPGTATVGTDYTDTSGTLTFDASTTVLTVSIDVIGDLDVELFETFRVVLSGAVGAPIADASGTVTIVDDDQTLVSIGDVTVAEGDTGGVALDVPVTLNIAAASNVTVAFDIVDTGSATAAVDYTTPAAGASGELVFTPGVLTRVVRLTINGDSVDELDETLEVRLRDLVGPAQFANDVAVVTIVDDDTVSVSAVDVSVDEADGTTVLVRATLTGVADRDVGVTYTISDVSTTDGVDYSGVTSGVLTWPALTSGDQTVSLDVLVDAIDEIDETLEVSLTLPTGGVTIADGTAVVTIVDDDTAELSIVDLTFGEADGTVAAVRVTLSGESSRTVSVSFATSDVSAAAGSDYQFASGVLTWAAGDVGVRTADVQIIDDGVDEADETFVVDLSGVVGGATIVGGSSGTVTVTDDDVAEFVVNAATADESSGSVTVSVTLTAASSVDTSVDYVTADGSATAASGDYVAIGSTTLAFPAGTTTRTFVISVADDAIDEADETIGVTLSNGVGAAIQTASASMTIVDDDSALLSVGDVVMTEGDGLPNTVTSVPVTLSTPSAVDVVVDFDVQAGAGANPATAGVDFVAQTSQVTIVAGSTSVNIDVEIIGDTIGEPFETVDVVVSSAAGASGIADDTGVLTIQDNDTPALFIDDASVGEGASGVDATFTISVRLTLASAQPVLVQYSTSSGGANPASAGLDFTGASGFLSFAAGETVKTFDVTVHGDDVDELDETFLVTLFSPVNAPISDGSGEMTIVDDDTTSLAVLASAFDENAGSPSTAVRVVLTGVSDRDVSVSFATNDGSALAGSDYTSASGVLTWPAGSSGERNAPVTIGNDGVQELDETVRIVLSGASAGTTISTSSADMTIRDDDATSVSLSLASASESDGNAPVVVATLVGSSDRAIVVTYSFMDGAAVAGGDYVNATGTITFGAFETGTRTGSVAIVDDAVMEASETFTVYVADVTAGTSVGTGSAVISVDDDDIVTLTTSATVSVVARLGSLPSARAAGRPFVGTGAAWRPRAQVHRDVVRAVPVRSERVGQGQRHPCDRLCPGCRRHGRAGARSLGRAVRDAAPGRSSRSRLCDGRLRQPCIRRLAPAGRRRDLFPHCRAPARRDDWFAAECRRPGCRRRRR